MTIYDYTDYRDIIRDFYLEKKNGNGRYSYSVLGQAIGLNASHVFCIVEKKRNLPVRCVPAVKRILGLTGRAARYFDLLLAASRTKSEKTKTEILAKAFLLRDVKTHSLADKEQKYLSDWWTPVIRALIEVNQGKVDVKEISESLEPSIEEDKVQESIDILNELGFIQDLGNGRVKLADAHINIAGEQRAQAIRQFQANVMQIGARSLNTIDPADRDISTLTMAVDQQGFEDIKAMIQEFRKDVQIRVDKCGKPTRVLQMNLALFPVAFNKKKAK
ncbi:TIGR02147 family protein [uncultured Fibrobacter sp.]|uniref:TIGR02147 family protein n=1 Tax=uncultured Fibrobacter sp. TaxID=261512 RepID=UPI001567B98B|nr:TIGR02147 family protein [uncultured Fibrobacter sp.]